MALQYAPYKPGNKGSLAERARALGLEPLALQIMKGDSNVNPIQYVKPQEKGLYCRFFFLSLNAKVLCFSGLLKCLRCLYGKSVDPDQTALIGAVCSGSTLFASILN